MNGEMPEIEMTTSDTDSDGMDGQAAKALMLRRFAHDVTKCNETNALLTALGLTHGSEEGQHLDHMDSHERLDLVGPLEQLLRPYAQVMGVVVSTAMTEAHGITEEMGPATALFAAQNAEVVLASSRAIIGHLMSLGIIVYGPTSDYLQSGMI